jgi:hypothetical protein
MVDILWIGPADAGPSGFQRWDPFYATLFSTPWSEFKTVKNKLFHENPQLPRHYGNPLLFSSIMFVL